MGKGFPYSSHSLAMHPMTTTISGSSNSLIVMRNSLTALPIQLSSGTVRSCDGYRIFIYMGVLGGSQCQALIFFGPTRV